MFLSKYKSKKSEHEMLPNLREERLRMHGFEQVLMKSHILQFYPVCFEKMSV